MHPCRPKQIIDVHAHLGVCNQRPWLGTRDLSRVLDRAAAVGVDLSILSHADALYDSERCWKSANLKLFRECEKRPDALMWWVVDPRSRRSIDLFENHAAHPKVMGMKIGPTYHHYRFTRYARSVFELAARTGQAILTHCGQANDLPSAMIPWANRYPRVRFIMAHYGNCHNFQGHLDAMVKCSSPACFVDTSSAVSINCNFIEKGVRRLGVARFFFGTDSPLYSTAAQLARILEADLSPGEKQAILGDNARKFLLKPPPF